MVGLSLRARRLVVITGAWLVAACGESGSGAAAGSSPEAGAPDAGLPDGGPEGGPPTFGGLTIDTPADEQQLDLFGKAGHRFWVEVSDEQLAEMNAAEGGGGPIFLEHANRPPLQPAYALNAEPFGGGDIYTPGNLVDAATFADHVVVRDVVSGSVADYGKLEVALVGESTFRTWNRRQIPNLRIDTDEFQTGLRVGDFEHIRLNNSLVGSIFREDIAHRIYRALGYPALRTSHVFLGSNVWGPDVWVPMTLVEVYKKRFCTDNEALLGGTCTNMWEFTGDAGVGDLPDNACQVHTCDDTRMKDLNVALRGARPGPGFQSAVADIVDWPRFHQFQCIGWILSTGDDAVHSMGNDLIIERSDGRLVFAPYSIDISAGHEWYPATPLLGQSTLARGCQGDPVCWAALIESCQDLVQKFDAMNPENLVDDARQQLTDLGMMRADDDARADELRDWLVQRQVALPTELERFRYLPDATGVCPNDLVPCNDHGCGTPEDCATRPCEAGYSWCETTQACIGSGEICTVCDGETPLFCPASYQCVTGTDICSQDCQIFAGPGTEYCPTTRLCEQVGFCPMALPDGGPPVDVPPDAGASDAAIRDASFPESGARDAGPG